MRQKSLGFGKWIIAFRVTLGESLVATKLYFGPASIPETLLTGAHLYSMDRKPLSKSKNQEVYCD